MPLDTGPLTLVLASAALLLVGCSKTAAVSQLPDVGPGTEAKGTGEDEGAVFRYSTGPLKLLERVELDYTTTGGGAYAQATAELEVELHLQGSASSQPVNVGWKIVGVNGLALAGALESNGEQPRQALLQTGTGAWEIDRSGRIDLSVTETLPANTPRRTLLAQADAAVAVRRAEDPAAIPPPGPVLLRLVPSLFALPLLPPSTLEVGLPLEVVRTYDTLVVGTDAILPVEVQTDYTLVRTETTGGITLAEVQVEVQEWGGVDLASGPVELRNTTSGTMLFDVLRGVPVSLSYTREQSLVVGELIYDTTTIVGATFELQ